MVKYMNELGQVSELSREDFVKLIQERVKQNKIIKKKKRINKMKEKWNRG